MQSVKRHVGCSFLCVLKECTVRKCHIMSHNKLLTWVFFLSLSLFCTSSWWHDIKLERLWLQQAGRWLEEKMVCQGYSYSWWTKRSNPASASLQATLSLTIVSFTPSSPVIDYCLCVYCEASLLSTMTSERADHDGHCDHSDVNNNPSSLRVSKGNGEEWIFWVITSSL